MLKRQKYSISKLHDINICSEYVLLNIFCRKSCLNSQSIKIPVNVYDLLSRLLKYSMYKKYKSVIKYSRNFCVFQRHFVKLFYLLVSHSTTCRNAKISSLQSMTFWMWTLLILRNSVSISLALYSKRIDISWNLSFWISVLNFAIFYLICRTLLQKNACKIHLFYCIVYFYIFV